MRIRRRVPCFSSPPTAQDQPDTVCRLFENPDALSIQRVPKQVPVEEQLSWEVIEGKVRVLCLLSSLRTNDRDETYSTSKMKLALFKLVLVLTAVLYTADFSDTAAVKSEVSEEHEMYRLRISFSQMQMKIESNGKAKSEILCSIRSAGSRERHERIYPLPERTFLFYLISEYLGKTFRGILLVSWFWLLCFRDAYRAEYCDCWNATSPLNDGRWT